jgi:hypothetical protein
VGVGSSSCESDSGCSFSWFSLSWTERCSFSLTFLGVRLARFTEKSRLSLGSEELSAAVSLSWGLHGSALTLLPGASRPLS